MLGDRTLNYWIAGGNKAKFVVCGMATCHSCASENQKQYLNTLLKIGMRNIHILGEFRKKSFLKKQALKDAEEITMCLEK